MAAYTGNFLRLANEEEPLRIYYEVDGEQTEEYIDVKREITKKTAAGLLKFAPKNSGNLEEGLRFIERACRDLIIGWSLPVDPNVENYQKLDAAAAQWIDSEVGEHLRKVLGVGAADAESKQESSDQTPSEESVSSED